MTQGTERILRGRVGAAGLLNSVSRTTLAAFSVGVALGVALPGEARAGSGPATPPSQTTTYTLGTYNPTIFATGTSINVATGNGVYGSPGTAWIVLNYGSVSGSPVGFQLQGANSLLTNGGAIEASGSYA